MPTPIGHSMGGLAAYIFGRHQLNRSSLVLFLFIWLAAVAPDIDYFPILWGDLNLANLNHQHYTHSIFFSVFSAVALAIIASWFTRFSWQAILPAMLFAALSHLLFDYFTYDGRYPVGIPLLWPLDIRFNAPVAVFAGVSKGSFADIFSLYNGYVILREIVIGGIVALATWWVVRIRQARVSSSPQPPQQ